MSVLDTIFFIFGFVALVGGAEVFVRGASAVARGFHISPVIIGLTVVAFGTSAPELAVTLEGVLSGSPGLAVGNVIGSNIANILLILGIGSVIQAMVVHQAFIRVEIPLLIVVSLAFWAMAANGAISRWEGALLFSGSLAYTIYAIRSAFKERRQVLEEYEKEFGDKPDHPKKSLLVNSVLILVGFVFLVAGSKGIVSGAVKLAVILGMDELVIGLTIVALGTSLPEVATSVMASLKGEGDIAIGNVVGSNMFNILVVAGLGAAASFKGLPVSAAAIDFDLPFMCLVSVALLPTAVSGHRISRKEGVLFLSFYVVYMVYLILAAKNYSGLAEYKMWAFFICGPVALFILFATAGRSMMRRQRRHSA